MYIYIYADPSYWNSFTGFRLLLILCLQCCSVIYFPQLQFLNYTTTWWLLEPGPCYSVILLLFLNQLIVSTPNDSSNQSVAYCSLECEQGPEWPCIFFWLSFWLSLHPCGLLMTMEVQVSKPEGAMLLCCKYKLFFPMLFSQNRQAVQPVSASHSIEHHRYLSVFLLIQ